jgi:uncharacterized protein (DUF2249 family)
MPGGRVDFFLPVAAPRIHSQPQDSGRFNTDSTEVGKETLKLFKNKKYTQDSVISRDI